MPLILYYIRDIASVVYDLTKLSKHKPEPEPEAVILWHDLMSMKQDTRKQAFALPLSTPQIEAIIKDAVAAGIGRATLKWDLSPSRKPDPSGLDQESISRLRAYMDQTITQLGQTLSSTSYGHRTIQIHLGCPKTGKISKHLA